MVSLKLFTLVGGWLSLWLLVFFVLGFAIEQAIKRWRR